MIYSIGTSNRSRDEFFAELDQRNIRTLIDVRSSPSSRVPCFNQRALVAEAEQRGLAYRWWGNLFGGRNGIATTAPDFQLGLSQLLQGADQSTSVIFCAEGDPALCHRSYKIGAALVVRGAPEVVNILRSGADEALIDTLGRTRPRLMPECLRAEVLQKTQGGRMGSLFPG